MTRTALAYFLLSMAASNSALRSGLRHPHPLVATRVVSHNFVAATAKLHPTEGHGDTFESPPSKSVRTGAML